MEKLQKLYEKAKQGTALTAAEKKEIRAIAKDVGHTITITRCKSSWADNILALISAIRKAEAEGNVHIDEVEHCETYTEIAKLNRNEDADNTEVKIPRLKPAYYSGIRVNNRVILPHMINAAVYKFMCDTGLQHLFLKDED